MRKVLQDSFQAPPGTAWTHAGGVQAEVGLQEEPEPGRQIPVQAAEKEDAGDPALEEAEERLNIPADSKPRPKAGLF